MLIINNYSLTWRWISTTFSDTEVNNFCFSIYHTCWITSRPKSNLICDNIPTKAILFLFGCSEVNNTWLITSELANQHAQKLFTCMAQYILLLLLLLLPLTTIIIIIQYCAKVMQTIIDEYREYRDISAIFNEILP